MKKLIILGAPLALLAGCAAPGPDYYGGQSHLRSGEPGGWQVVSVTPVPLGTGARLAAGAPGTAVPAGAASRQPVVVHRTPVYTQPVPRYAEHHGPHHLPPPVYVPRPVYLPEPVYQPRYYYPPVTIGLGFNFGRGYHRGWGRHRGWSGQIGTHFPLHYWR